MPFRCDGFVYNIQTGKLYSQGSLKLGIPNFYVVLNIHRNKDAFKHNNKTPERTKKKRVKLTVFNVFVFKPNE